MTSDELLTAMIALTRERDALLVERDALREELRRESARLDWLEQWGWSEETSVTRADIDFDMARHDAP